MSLFSLEIKDLTNLGPDRAVSFFRKLLWAEALQVGISRNMIDVPENINVPDGGIDAIIRDANPTSDEVIPQGLTGFQIKSSDLCPSRCKQELHINGDIHNDLKPEIKQILESDGTYVLVLFADITTQQKRKREEAIKQELEEFGYRNPKIRIYTASQIIEFANRFPAVICYLKPHITSCMPYELWHKNFDVSNPYTFVVDPEREK